MQFRLIGDEIVGSMSLGDEHYIAVTTFHCGNYFSPQWNPGLDTGLRGPARRK